MDEHVKVTDPAKPPHSSIGKYVGIAAIVLFLGVLILVLRMRDAGERATISLATPQAARTVTPVPPAPQELPSTAPPADTLPLIEGTSGDTASDRASRNARPEVDRGSIMPEARRRAKGVTSAAIAPQELKTDLPKPKAATNLTRSKPSEASAPPEDARAPLMQKTTEASARPISPSEVRKVITAHGHEVESCYRDENIPPPKQKVVVALTVQPSGEVSSATVNPRRLGPQSVTNCIAMKAKNWKFRALGGSEPQEITIPFIAVPRETHRLEEGRG